MRARFDIVVVGGGPAGLATAIHLSREGWGVLVAEHTDYSAPRIGEHLPPSAKPVLADLGLADILASGAHASSPGVRSLWGSDEPVDKDYLFDPHGEGINLSRPQFDRSLAAQAESFGAEVRTQTKVAELAHVAGAWHVSLAAGTRLVQVTATVVVDATGRAASVAKRLGARPEVVDDLVGLVGRGRDGSEMRSWVLIEAQEEGWWYSAGLADGSCIATFLTDPDLADLSQAGRAAAWKAQLAKSTLTCERADPDGATGPLQVRTARTQRLDRVAGEGWLAVGDAAMSFDPLSSEGISKGLQMGRAAATLAAAFCRGESGASMPYERDVKLAFDEYLAARRDFYAAERRWPDALFWQRRRAAGDI